MLLKLSLEDKMLNHNILGCMHIKQAVAIFDLGHRF